MAPNNHVRQLVTAAQQLCNEVEKLKFLPPVTHVYNPLTYAWAAHETYLRRFGAGPKSVIFLGMNPGPFGMVQTGVPFGEISAVRDWMKINAPITKPKLEHLRRPILGFNCSRSEVSGKRLWGLFAERFETPEEFFSGHFVVNYCPLAFLTESGANFTPNKLPRIEANALMQSCDTHLRTVLDILKPKWIIGVGAYAEERARIIAEGLPIQVGQILHPSPASPAANRGWGVKATEQMCAIGIWK